MLLEISDLMKQESPVFIVGAPRSGTSILYLTLQKHSNFKPWNCSNDSEAELTESNIFRLPYDTYLVSASAAFAYMLHNQTFYEQFTAAIQPIYHHQKLLLGKRHLYKIIPKLPFIQPSTRISLWRLLENDLLVRSFFYYAKLARGAHRIVEKTPQHISLLPEIKATFPQSKLIYIARHPVDVFSSYRRRLKDALKLGNSKTQLNWLNLSLKVFCEKYTNYINIALQESINNPQNFLLIRYEDFVTDTRDALKQIFGFLKESYESGCVLEKRVHKVNWQGDPNLFDGIKQKTKEWQSYVQASEADLIEMRLASVMKQLGYANYTQRN